MHDVVSNCQRKCVYKCRCDEVKKKFEIAYFQHVKNKATNDLVIKHQNVFKHKIKDSFEHWEN